MDMVAGQDDALTAGATMALALPAGSEFTQSPSAMWQTQWTDFAKDPACTYRLTEPTRWRCLNRDASAAIKCSGRLIGGCIDTLMHTAGTRFGDVRRFIAEAGHEGVLLYLENAEQSPTSLVRALHRLRWAGWFDGLAGLLIGRNAAPEASGEGRLHCADALQSVIGALPCPVLADLDIGHKPPQMLLVNGALATLHWSASGGASLVQRLA